MSYHENSTADARSLDHHEELSQPTPVVDDETTDPEGKAQRVDQRIPPFLRDKFQMNHAGTAFMPTREFLAILTELSESAVASIKQLAEADASTAVVKLVEAHEALVEVTDGGAYGLYRAVASQANYGLQRLVSDLHTDIELSIQDSNNELSERGVEFQGTIASRIASAKVELPIWQAAANRLAACYEPDAQVTLDARMIAKRAGDSEARYNTDRYLYGPTRSATATDPSEAKAFARKQAMAKLGQV